MTWRIRHAAYQISGIAKAKGQMKIVESMSKAFIIIILNFMVYTT